MDLKYIINILLLVVAVVAVSSAATFFTLLGDVPATLKATWRLQVTCACQIPTAVYEAKMLPFSLLVFYRNNWWVIFLSGFFLGVHFSLWAASLALTSMVHSLVLVCCAPILVILVMLFTPTKPTILQITGVFISFGGILIMIVVPSSSSNSDIIGDLLAFGGAISIVVYMFAGKHIRQFNVL